MISAYSYPGINIKEAKTDLDKKKLLRAERILAVICSYFSIDKDKIFISRKKIYTNAKKYYYWFLNRELNITYYYIEKHISGETHGNIKFHVGDIEDKIMIKDIETLKTIEEIKKYLK